MFGSMPTRREGPVRFRISTVFSVVVAMIVLASVGLVVAATTINARLSLIRGLAEEFDLIIGAVEARVVDHLSAVEDQLVYLDAFLVAEPEILSDDGRLAEALRLSIAATPQVTAIAFMRPDRNSVRIERDDPRAVVGDLSTRADLVPLLDEARRRGPDGDLGWSEPLFSPNVGRSIVVRRQPVWDGNRFLGLLLAGVDLIELSVYSGRLSANVGQTVFVLYGEDRVIAHPAMAQTTAALSEQNPMPALDELGDPRLARIWRADRHPVISQELMERSRGHYRRTEGGWEVYVYDDVTGFGRTPWLIGFHFFSGQGSEVRRFWLVSAFVLALLVAFVLLGGWLGRRLSRPFEALTQTAIAVQRLEFASIRPLKESRIAELDRAARAFEAMVAGLRVFGRYVPRRLVEIILREGRDSIRPDERQVTLLFLDIVSFSTMAEGMPPAATAAFLNEQFELVGECVDAEAGTIDKYLGDGLLAFWNAPEPQPDHADRACRAALAIRRVLAERNAERRQRGERPVRLRIGIHTGPAIVGDIGAASRINYTAIGDAVNVAARVEQVARNYASGDVTIVITQKTLEALEGAYPDPAEALGAVALRGRTQDIELFRL